MFPLVYIPSLDFEITELSVNTATSKEFYKTRKKTVPEEDTIMPFSLFAKPSKHNTAGHKLVMYKLH